MFKNPSSFLLKIAVKHFMNFVNFNFAMSSKTCNLIFVMLTWSNGILNDMNPFWIAWIYFEWHAPVGRVGKQDSQCKLCSQGGKEGGKTERMYKILKVSIKEGAWEGICGCESTPSVINSCVRLAFDCSDDKGENIKEEHRKSLLLIASVLLERVFVLYKTGNKSDLHFSCDEICHWNILVGCGFLMPTLLDSMF